MCSLGQLSSEYGSDMILKILLCSKRLQRIACNSCVKGTTMRYSVLERSGVCGVVERTNGLSGKLARRNR